MAAITGPSIGTQAQEPLPVDIPWQRDERGYYHRLLRLRPRDLCLVGVGGLYVIWHRGVRPRWIYVGGTDDLGEAINRAQDSEAILAYEAFGGLYVTWAPIDEGYRDGAVNYLRGTLEPVLDTLWPVDLVDPGAPPVAINPPN